MTAEEYAKHLASRHPDVPRHTCQGLADYVVNRIPPGDFIGAVVANDLVTSFAKADRYNQAAMHSIARLIWNELPVPCWGSPAKVKAWLAACQEVQR